MDMHCIDISQPVEIGNIQIFQLIISYIRSKAHGNGFNQKTLMSIDSIWKFLIIKTVAAIVDNERRR